MSFVLPWNPVHSVAAQYKFEVGGHTGRGTLTRGNGHPHSGSAVDTNAPYPAPSKVSFGFISDQMNLMPRLADCTLYARPRTQYSVCQYRGTQPVVVR